MKKFAVFGNPIAHSLSPDIHQMFAVAADMAIEYTRECAEPAAFENDVNRFFNDPQAVGCNVTVPFKTRAYAMADVTDHAAAAAGAVNTFMMRDNTLYGYNTDGVGLVRDLQAQDISLENKTILLLGAGGAARGVIFPLLDAGVANIKILNRTASKAQTLVEQVDSAKVKVTTGMNEGVTADLVINSTSAGLTDDLPTGLSPAVFRACELAYDMVYGVQDTAFMTYAKEHGATRQSDGLGMLVEQAAEAFRLWTDVDPKTSSVKQAIRRQLT